MMDNKDGKVGMIVVFYEGEKRKIGTIHKVNSVTFGIHPYGGGDGTVWNVHPAICTVVPDAEILAILNGTH